MLKIEIASYRGKWNGEHSNVRNVETVGKLKVVKNVDMLTCLNLKCWRAICISFFEWFDQFKFSTFLTFSIFNFSRFQHFQHFSFQLFNFSTFPTSQRWSIQIYLAFWSLGWLIGGQLIGSVTNIVLKFLAFCNGYPLGFLWILYILRGDTP